jgi:hypothetical protein
MTTTFAVPTPGHRSSSETGSSAGSAGAQPGRQAPRSPSELEEAQQRLADIANSVLHSSMLAASMLPMLPPSVQETAYAQLEELDGVVRQLRAVIVDLAESG